MSVLQLDVEDPLGPIPFQRSLFYHAAYSVGDLLSSQFRLVSSILQQPSARPLISAFRDDDDGPGGRLRITAGQAFFDFALNAPSVPLRWSSPPKVDVPWGHSLASRSCVEMGAGGALAGAAAEVKIGFRFSA